MSTKFRQMLKLIPKNVIDALWFADGEQENYTSPRTPIFYQNDYFRIEITYSEEPSLIFSTDEIGTILNPVPALKYYPSYERLTPDERATYLNWLRNIETEIDIGYVFIFYYGLERWLLFGDESKFENAFNLILTLRKYHKNNSFQSYSSEALMAVAVAREKHSRLKDILTADFRLTPLTLAYLAYVGFYLEARHIISLASAVGFKKSRYMKNEPELFLKSLNEQMAENYSECGYHLTQDFFKDSLPLKTQCFANYSLNKKCVIPDILQNEIFRKDLNNLLLSTHEKVKALLRKKKKLASER